MLSYADAAPNKNCIYAFVKGSKPVYIGQAAHFATRFRPGYRFLISALLDSHYKIYVACIPPRFYRRLSDIEGELISTFQPRYNTRKPAFRPLGLALTAPWTRRGYDSEHVE
jgi:hypothetical protein